MRTFIDRLARFRWHALVLALILIPLHSVFTSSAVLYAKDNAREYWQVHLWLRRTLLAGRSPLWDPYFAFGQPAAGDPARQIFFPTLPLRLLLPEVLGYNVLTALPVVAAGLGMLLCLRGRASNAAAALGAILFAASGLVLSSTVYENISWSVALMPWVFWGARRLTSAPSAARLALLAGFFAVLALAGEPLTMTGTGALAVVCVVIEEDGLRERTRAVALTVAAGLAGVLLASVQVFPSGVAYRDSVRSQHFGANIANIQSLHPLWMLGTVVPRIFGDPFRQASSPWLLRTESYYVALYVGGGALALAAAGALVGRPRRWALLWSIVVPITTICAFGRYTPIYPILQTLFPPLLGYRGPMKYATFAAFGVAALACAGFEAVVERRDARARVASVVVLVVVASGALAALMAVTSCPTLVEGLASRAGIGDVASASVVLKKALLLEVPRVAAVAAGLALLIGFRPTSPKAKRLACGAAFAIVALDPITANVGLLPTAPVALIGEPAWLSSLAGRPDARIYIAGRATINLIGGGGDAVRVTGTQRMLEAPEALVTAYVDGNRCVRPWRVEAARGNLIRPQRSHATLVRNRSLPIPGCVPCGAFPVSRPRWSRILPHQSATRWLRTLGGAAATRAARALRQRTPTATDICGSKCATCSRRQERDRRSVRFLHRSANRGARRSRSRARGRHGGSRKRSIGDDRRRR